MHPTTLSVWGWYQLTFKTFGPSKSIWYTLFHCYHWARPIHFVHCHHLGHAMTLHVSWGQVQLTAQLWSMSFRFSGPVLDPTWLSPWCQKLCPIPSRPCPSHPPLIFSHRRGACKSHIWNRFSNPTRRSGVYNYMQSYMSYLSFLWKTLQFIF